MSNEDEDVPTLDVTLQGHKTDILAVDFMPNGHQLVSSSSDGSIVFWNLDKSNKHSSCYQLKAHKDVVFSVVCAPNGSFVLSSSRDKTVRLWRMKNERPLENSILYKCPASVRCVDSSPDSEYFCAASDDKTVKLWSSLHTNKYVCSFGGHNNWVRSCKYSKFNNNLVASCGDDSCICLFDVRMKKRIEKITSKAFSHFLDINWYPCSDCLLAVSSQDSSVRIYDIRANKLIQYYASHTQSVNSISIHPMGGYLLSSSTDETSKIFDLLEGRILFTLKLHKGSIYASKFSPDGNTFATAGNDKVIHIWKSNLFASKVNRTPGLANTLNENLTEEIEIDDSVNGDAYNSGCSVTEINTQLKKVVQQLSSLLETVSRLEQRVTKLENNQK